MLIDGAVCTGRHALRQCTLAAVMESRHVRVCTTHACQMCHMTMPSTFMYIACECYNRTQTHERVLH